MKNTYLTDPAKYAATIACATQLAVALVALERAAVANPAQHSPLSLLGMEVSRALDKALAGYFGAYAASVEREHLIAEARASR